MLVVVQMASAQISPENMELLLETGNINAVEAWGAIRELNKVAPELMTIDEEIVSALVPYLANPQTSTNAQNVILRSGEVGAAYLSQLVADSEQSLKLRDRALPVLTTLAAKDTTISTLMYELLIEESTPYLLRVSLLESLQKINDVTQFDLTPYTELYNYIVDDKIVFRIDNNSAEPVIDRLVKAVIPIPQLANSGENLAIVNASETPLTAEIKVLQTWDTGQARIVEINMPVTLDGYGVATYYLDLAATPGQDTVDLSNFQSAGFNVSFLGEGLLSLSDITKMEKEGWVSLMIVAADGSGQFTSVQDAIDAVPANNQERVQIFIRDGVYKEKLTVPNNKPFISLIGESSAGTILTYDDCASTIGLNGSNLGTTGSTSFAAKANDFTAENLTFENSAGKNAGQAVAIRTTGDRMVFKNVRFLGYQDTLYVTQGRQYFVNCYVYGDVDFIFGNATAVFENCDIVSSPKGGYVTAASNDEGAEFGYVFLNSRFTSEAAPNSHYLGRPWRPYAHVAIINCWIDDHIRPVGWHNWNNSSNEQTAQYYEYKNCGPGSDTSSRAQWTRELTDEEAALYTVENVLKGTDDWNPKQGM